MCDSNDEAFTTILPNIPLAQKTYKSNVYETHTTQNFFNIRILCHFQWRSPGLLLPPPRTRKLKICRVGKICSAIGGLGA